MEIPKLYQRDEMDLIELELLFMVVIVSLYTWEECMCMITVFVFVE